MIQGTTPTIVLRVPMDTKHITDAEFTLNDYDKNVRTWKLKDMSAEGWTLKIDLTESETLGFNAKLHKAQLRIKTTDGKIMASKVMPISVYELLSGVTI